MQQLIDKSVKKIASECEMFFVIGSRNSSNSVRLVEVAKQSGCEKSELFILKVKLPFDEIIKCSKDWYFIWGLST